MSRFETTDDLLNGILEGKVPRQVRLFAAQGLLPISREDLLRLQVLLSTDPDTELAKVAEASVAEVEEATLVDWVKSYTHQPLELDLLVRLRDEESIWVAVATSPEVSDETLRVLAKNGGNVVQDIIITNQVRIFNCLEILEDLRANRHIADTILRRVREFEEEFLEKALAAEGALGGADAPTIEEALAALRLIGAHIPALDRLPYQRPHEDAGLQEAVGLLGGGDTAFSRLLKMNIKEKVICALKSSREERAILINSRNRLVVRAVLACPRLSDGEVEVFAGSRTVDTEVLRIINRNPRWTRRYQVALQLCLNPKTPVELSMRLVPRLNTRDLKRLAINRNINPVVRRSAQNFAQRRR
jgi:hypothetical protein